MIITIFVKILLFLVDIVAYVLPNWKLPPVLIDGWNYFLPPMIMMIKAFPVLQTLIVCGTLIFTFQLYLLIANISFSFLGFFRGSGKPEV